MHAPLDILLWWEILRTIVYPVHILLKDMPLYHIWLIYKKSRQRTARGPEVLQCNSRTDTPCHIPQSISISSVGFVCCLGLLQNWNSTFFSHWLIPIISLSLDRMGKLWWALGQSHLLILKGHQQDTYNHYDILPTIPFVWSTGILYSHCSLPYTCLNFLQNNSFSSLPALQSY